MDYRKCYCFQGVGPIAKQSRLKFCGRSRARENERSFFCDQPPLPVLEAISRTYGPKRPSQNVANPLKMSLRECHSKLKGPFQAHFVRVSRAVCSTWEGDLGSLGAMAEPRGAANAPASMAGGMARPCMAGPPLAPLPPHGSISRAQTGGPKPGRSDGIVAEKAKRVPRS